MFTVMYPNTFINVYNEGEKCVCVYVCVCVWGGGGGGGGEEEWKLLTFTEVWASSHLTISWPATTHIAAICISTHLPTDVGSVAAAFINIWKISHEKRILNNSALIWLVLDVLLSKCYINVVRTRIEIQGPVTSNRANSDVYGNYQSTFPHLLCSQLGKDHMWLPLQVLHCHSMSQNMLLQHNH